MIAGKTLRRFPLAGDRLTTPILISGILLLSAFAHWASWSSMLDVWGQRASYSHGYLIVLVSLAMIFSLKARLSEETPSPAPLMLIPLIAASTVWVIMVLANIQVLHQMLLPLLIWLAIFAVSGGRVARLLLVPLFYLLMAMPVWDVVNPLLQIMTVRAIEFLLNVVGVSSYIDGNIVTLPNGVFEIAGGCSGLHFFVVGLSIGVAYAFAFVRGRIRFAATVAIAAAFSILANWLRVFVVIIAGYVTDMQHFLVTVDHYHFGWIVYALSLIPFYYVVRTLEEREASARSNQPVNDGRQNVAVPRVSSVATAVLAIAIGTSVFLDSRQIETDNPSQKIVMPAERGGWIQASAGTGDWTPYFSGPAAESGVTYSLGDTEIQVYANIYFVQRQGRELVGFVNRIEGNDRWQPTGSGGRTVQLGAAQYREIVLRDQRQNERVVVYWYEVGGRKVATDLEANLTYAVKRLFGKPMAGIVAVSARCESNCEDARQRISSWLQGQGDTAGRQFRLGDLISAEPELEPGEGKKLQRQTRYYVHRAPAENPLVFMRFLYIFESVA